MISPIIEVIHSPTRSWDKYLPHKIGSSLHFSLLCNHFSISTTIKFLKFLIYQLHFFTLTFFYPFKYLHPIQACPKM